MAALTAHYVTHARFLWKWLRNPDNRRNKLPFRQKRWACRYLCGKFKIVLYMEIVSIEKKTFGEMMAQTDAFVEKVAALQRKGDGKRLGKWLTGEEVCGQLRISLRTLQKLRDRGFIGYSQIGFRFYYKPEDVKRLIPLIGTICPTDK